MAVLKFKIGGMTCSGCAASVERAASRVPGVAQAKVDLEAGTASIEADAAKADAISAAIRAAGFEVSRA